jgi:CheY-like chemotaxis protein
MAETQFAILCVDDEPAVLHPLEIMLKRRGFHVVTAHDGPSAIELFRQIKFDAVVLDYVMPGMSGGQVAEVMRQENPNVPIILHTGYKDTEDPLLANVSCTLPKGSLSFLVTKLNDLLHTEAPAVEEQPAEAVPDATHSAHVA